MKLVVVALLALVAVARADTATLVKQYSGRIIVSPDPAPTVAAELPDYVKANAVAGDHYALMKGSPWQIHLIGFLSKDPGAAKVQLVFVDTTDKEAKPLLAVDVSTKNRLVISKAAATTAAGFEAGKTYTVQLLQGKT